MKVNTNTAKCILSHNILILHSQWHEVFKLSSLVALPDEFNGKHTKQDTESADTTNSKRSLSALFGGKFARNSLKTSLFH